MARTPEEREALIDAILDEYESGLDRYNRGEWSNKHSEALAPYAEKLKALNGDDFDLINAAYDEYHKDYKELSEEDYCKALVSNIEKVLGNLKKALQDGDIEAAKEEADNIQEITNEEQSEEAPIEETTVITDDPEVAKEAVEEAIDEADEFQKSLDEEYSKSDKSRVNY